MKQNVGGADRTVRFVLGVVLLGAGYFLMAWWLMLVGVVVFLTGWFRFCGAYTLFGVSTCKVEPGVTEMKQ